MPSAFVTGGSGFVGGALIRSLVAGGWRVRALARSDAAARAVEEAGAEPVRGEVTDGEAVRAGAEDCEYAFHAAAKVDDWGDPDEYSASTCRARATSWRPAARRACAASCTWAPRRP